MIIFSPKRIALLVFLLVGTASLSGCGTSTPASVGYSVSLEVWGVLDDSDAYGNIFGDYRKLNPNVKSITYRKLPIETYRADLINALASGKGPDIFMIRNPWRSAFEDKTAPAPNNLISEQEYRNRLVDVAADDFINADKKIYGVPLSVDSLSLYYNKDLFNTAGITRPPETWDEVKSDARLLGTIDQFGTIIRSAIALGTGANINRSPDILMALMMQSRATSDSQESKGPVNFSDESSVKILDFYTQFSRVGSDVYSWNARQDYSLDAFYKGNLAMMINYSWQYDTIKQKNAKLNIGVAPLPQFDKTNPANVANYWGYVVAKDKPAPPTPSGQSSTTVSDPEKKNQARIFEAWQFLKYLTLVGQDKKMNVMDAFSGTSKEVSLGTDPTKAYLAITHKPAARRDLVAEQKDDLILSPFAYGNLIAKNWYQGDSEAVDGILIDMIDSVVRGEKSSKTGLDTASSRINLLIR